MNEPCNDYANIVLSEWNQTQRAIYFMIPFVCIDQTRQTYRDSKNTSSCQRLRGGRNGEKLQMGMKFLLGTSFNKNFLELDNGDDRPVL